ncbi:unnamed protein product [Plutella xylostella]|uniref:(diamondback moth) hypothetical protein n=1 Tax=Plutella xylostella TaxID=51655 RepID=A0A8S4EGD3_PLUXY|nr:unnamed protein product [Plutella xylostella]
MSTSLMDTDAILSSSEHWSRLDEQWGTPIDLETDDQQDDNFVPPTSLQSFFSTIDLRPKHTFDSAIMLRRVQRKVYDSLSKRSAASVNYKDFIQELDRDEATHKERVDKQFYYIGGQIISAASVDEICDNIDDIFKSVSKLSATTSTIRPSKAAKPAPKIPEVVECSFSTSDLSFDDTHDFEKEKSDGDDVDRFIDELFDELNQTMASLQTSSVLDQSGARILDQTTTIESVTTLVKKFSSILESPAVKCSPRRQRQCCERFKDLADFWKNRTLQL